MIAAQLRITKPIYLRKINTGGMFPDKVSIHLDPDGGDYPYFAYAQDGWGRGVGRRYASIDEAKENLDRLHKML